MPPVGPFFSFIDPALGYSFEAGDPPLRVLAEQDFLASFHTPHALEKDFQKLTELLEKVSRPSINIEVLFNLLNQIQLTLKLEIPLFAGDYQQGIKVQENTVASVELSLAPDQDQKSNIILRVKLNRPLKVKKYGLTVDVHGLGWKSGGKIWADSEIFIGGRVARDVTKMATEMIFGEGRESLDLGFQDIYELIPKLKEKIGAGNQSEFVEEEERRLGCNSTKVMKRRLNHMADLSATLYTVDMNWDVNLAQALGVPVAIHQLGDNIFLDGYGLEFGQDAFMRLHLESISFAEGIFAEDINIQFRLDFLPFKETYSSGDADLYVQLDHFKIGELRTVSDFSDDREVNSSIRGLSLEDVKIALKTSNDISQNEINWAKAKFKADRISGSEDIVVENLSGEIALSMSADEFDLSLDRLKWDMPQLNMQNALGALDLEEMQVRDAFFHVRKYLDSVNFDFYLTPSVFINLFRFVANTSLVDGRADCGMVSGEGVLNENMVFDLLACDLQVNHLIQVLQTGQIDLEQFQSKFLFANLNLGSDQFYLDIEDTEFQFATSLISPVLTHLQTLGDLGQITVFKDSSGEKGLHLRELVIGADFKSAFESGQLQYSGLGSLASLDLYQRANSSLFFGRYEGALLNGNGKGNFQEFSGDFNGNLEFQFGNIEYRTTDSFFVSAEANYLVGQVNARSGPKSFSFDGDMRVEKFSTQKNPYETQFDVKSLTAFGQVDLRIPGHVFRFNTQGSEGYFSLGALTWFEQRGQRWQLSVLDSLVRGFSYYRGGGISAALYTRSVVKQGILKQSREGFIFESQKGWGVKLRGTLKRRVKGRRLAQLKVQKSDLKVFSLRVLPNLLAAKLKYTFVGEGVPNHFFPSKNTILLLDEHGEDRVYKFRAHKQSGSIRIDRKTFLGAFQLDMEAK